MVGNEAVETVRMTTADAEAGPDHDLFDPSDAEMAARDQGYLWLVLAGAAMAVASVASFLPWGELERIGLDLELAGRGNGGWVTFAAGCAIAILALVGYFWNPFSDPEAAWIAVFSAAALGYGVYKVFDLDNLADFEPDVGVGLWIVLASAGIGLLGSLAILLLNRS